MSTAPSPITDKSDLVTFKILMAGAPIKEEYNVVSIHVNKVLNKIPTARIELWDGIPAKQEWPVSDATDFNPGAEIEIKAGYHSTDKTIFKGVVIKHSLKVGADEQRLIIECKDKAVKMTIGRNSAFYEKKKDSDIISTLIGNSAGLTKTVAATTEQHKEVVQYQTSDWDFMMTRAEINGYIVNVNDGKVTVGKPTLSGAAVLGISYGEEILEFNAEMNAENQYKSVEAEAWDYKKQAVESNTSAEPSVNSQGNITGKKLSDVASPAVFSLKSAAPISKSQLKIWANATLLRSRMSAIRGDVSFQGSDLALPDKVIELDGVGKKFNGKAYVSGVEHRIEDGRWTTKCTFGLSNDWFYDKVKVSNPDTSGLIPAISGLQIGTVKKIDSDPDSEFRIQVALPIVDDAKPVWARLSNFYSTKDSGAFFIPEIADEVIIGFINDDPRYPVILGSVYSSTKIKAKYTPDDKNTIKAILTKAGLLLEFNDEDKIITIETPAGNKMIFSDKDKKISILDQNSNKVIMSDSGIEMSSPKDIKVKATGALTLEGTKGVTIKSPQDVGVSGLNVECKANVGFTAKGNATAELSASGQTTVKGAMVMIN